MNNDNVIKKITSYTIHETAEGTRATFTYSVIDEYGTVVKSNARATIILMNSDILEAADTIKTFLSGRIPD